MQHPSFDAIIEEIKDLVDVRDPGETEHIPEYVRIEPLDSEEARVERDVRFVYFLGEREREQDWREGLRVADTPLAERLPWIEDFHDREVQTSLREALGEQDQDGQRFTLDAAPSFRDYDQVLEVAYALPLLRDIQAAFAHKNAVKVVVREQLERRTFRLPMGLPLSFDRAIEAGPESGRIALCNLLRPEVIQRVRDGLRGPVKEAIAGRVTERAAALREVRAADLAAYPARKRHVLDATERSVFRNGAFDSADELRFAVLADRCPDLVGWLYNHRLGVGLRIEYDWQGHLTHYYPDFIVRVRWAGRFHNLIVEVKGRMDERDLAKARAGRRYADVLAMHDGEPWHYLLVREDPKVGRADLSWLESLAAPSMAALLKEVEGLFDRDSGDDGQSALAYRLLTRDGIGRLIARVTTETGSVEYDKLMALAEVGEANRDQLLIVAESMATDRHPRLRRVFVDRESGRDLPDSEVVQRLERAANGEELALAGIDVVYRAMEDGT
jgi:hypothetical protein